MIENRNSEYAVFTVCNLAYLPKALVLAASVLEFNDVKLQIFLFERKVPVDFSGIDADISWIEDMGVPNLYELAFKYDIIEFSTSLKPYLALKLLERFQRVIFLDPDTCVYHPLTPILADLNDHSIVLTPHYTTPQSDDASESDIGMMRFGSFNLGFFAIKNSQQGLYFLEWWSRRCRQFSFMESQFGLSTDQKWVSIAPCFFADLYVSFNLGYNVAPWNVYERSLTKDGERYLINGKSPLIFFHFSNFNQGDPEYLNKRSYGEKGVKKPILFELATAYGKALIDNKTVEASIKYGFDYMSNGEYISPTLRRAYACISNELPAGHDPFDSNSVVGIFARKNYLFETKAVPYKSSGFTDIAAHQHKMKYIYFLMRVVLRLIGPNKFQNLSRLMVYLSSYRQNRGLWKY